MTQKFYFCFKDNKTISKKGKMDTNPGYALSSTSFSVKFVCAQQKKIVSYLLEYETDWKEVRISFLFLFSANTFKLFNF